MMLAGERSFACWKPRPHSTAAGSRPPRPARRVGTVTAPRRLASASGRARPAGRFTTGTVMRPATSLSPPGWRRLQTPVEAMSDPGRPWRWPAKQEPTEVLCEPSALSRRGRNPRRPRRGGGQLHRYTAERPQPSPREGMVERALVLNASYQPICVVPVRRAVVLVLKEKADVLVPGD